MSLDKADDENISSQGIDKQSTKEFIWKTIAMLVFTIVVILVLNYFLYNYGETLLAVKFDHIGELGGVLQGTIGVAAALAGALVAIKLASNSVTLSENQNRITELQARNDDPDFQLAKKSVRTYQDFCLYISAFQTQYDEWCSESESATYSENTPDTSNFNQASWKVILEKISGAMTSSEFSTLINHFSMKYEKDISKYYSIIYADLNRLSFATSINDLKAIYSKLNSDIQSFNRAMHKCKSSLVHDTEISTDNYFSYLKKMAQHLNEISVDNNSVDQGLNSTASENFYLGKKNSDSFTQIVRDAIEITQESSTEKLKDLGSYFVDYGAHYPCAIATSHTDKDTIEKVKKVASCYATTINLKLELLILDTKKKCADLPKDHIWGDESTYLIVVCNRSTLLDVFREGLLGPQTRGCIIVDGLRSSDFKDTEGEFCKLLQLSDQKYTSKIIFNEFIKFVTGKAVEKELRENINFCDENGNCETKITWIGIDYRKVGVTPSIGNDNYMGELWQFFTAFQCGQFAKGHEFKEKFNVKD